MKTSLLCLLFLEISCVVFADVSPFYRVNTNVKGEKSNERRLGDIHGSQEQESVMASILNSRGLNVGSRPEVVVTGKGKPKLGVRGKGKGNDGFQYKDRETSKSSKSSKKGKGSSKGKGGKGKGATGIINPIPTHPITTTAPPVASPVMPQVDAISGDTTDAISGDTTNPNSGDTTDAISGDTTNPISGDTNDAISGDTNNAISDDRNDAISGDDPISSDTGSGNDGNSGDGGDTSSGDSGDTGSSGQQLLNFIMESTEVNSLDDQANFQLTTTLTLNGDLFDVIEDNGTFSRGSSNLGDFRGVCTITGAEHYLCHYELYFRTRGSVGAGGVTIKGPVSGAESVAVVTGTSFDYSVYDTGSVSLFQDPNNRWLVARTELFLQGS